MSLLHEITQPNGELGFEARLQVGALRPKDYTELCNPINLRSSGGVSKIIMS